VVVVTDEGDRSKWVRCIVLATKRDDMTQEEFDDHWVNVHSEIGRRYPNVVRYSQLRVKETGSITAEDLPVHGIVDFIYTSEQGGSKIPESPAGKEGADDLANFVDRTVKFFVEENVVIDHLGLGPLTGHELVSEPVLYP
jgi:uncharacterized protein (TIGR02118 family)